MHCRKPGGGGFALGRQVVPESPHTLGIASPAHASAAVAQDSPSNIAGTSACTGAQGRTVAGAIDTDPSLSGGMTPEEKQSPLQLEGAS
ncbi:MAG: hypothetical protein IT372_06815 [Polyangiaceae bacterium]|nr:hypothetical protein [Polyangiaceae bacterium]